MPAIGMPMNDTTGRKPGPTTYQSYADTTSRRPVHCIGEPFGCVPRSWQRNVRTHLELKVLLVLASYADVNGFCHPKKKTIANDALVSERSVQRALVSLEKGGFLTKTTRSAHLGSEYRLQRGA
jgi:hypothetical protein